MEEMIYILNHSLYKSTEKSIQKIAFECFPKFIRTLSHTLAGGKANTHDYYFIIISDSTIIHT